MHDRSEVCSAEFNLAICCCNFICARALQPTYYLARWLYCPACFPLIAYVETNVNLSMRKDECFPFMSALALTHGVVA